MSGWQSVSCFGRPTKHTAIKLIIICARLTGCDNGVAIVCSPSTRIEYLNPCYAMCNGVFSGTEPGNCGNNGNTNSNGNNNGNNNNGNGNVFVDDDDMSSCSGGCRRRYNFLSMSDKDRRRFTSTFSRLSTGGAGESLKRRYDNLIARHQNIWSDGRIHESGAFLPWHRWYLNQIEDLLQARQIQAADPCAPVLPHSQRKNPY